MYKCICALHCDLMQDMYIVQSVRCLQPPNLPCTPLHPTASPPCLSLTITHPTAAISHQHETRWATLLVLSMSAKQRLFLVATFRLLYNIECEVLSFILRSWDAHMSTHISTSGLGYHRSQISISGEHTQGGYGNTMCNDKSPYQEISGGATVGQWPITACRLLQLPRWTGRAWSEQEEIQWLEPFQLCHFSQLQPGRIFPAHLSSC